MRKTLYAILMVALLLISAIPMAFAEDDEGRDRPVAVTTAARNPMKQARADMKPGLDRIRDAVMDKYKDLSPEEQERLRERLGNFTDDQKKSFARVGSAIAKKFSNLDSNETRKLMGASAYALKNVNPEKFDNPEFRKQFVNRINEDEKLKNNNYKVRQTPQGKLDAARKRYENAKEKYEEARSRYQEVKGRFDDAKEKIEACKADSESEDCAEAIEKSKEFVTHTIDVVIGSMEKLIEKIESSEQISEEDAAAKIEAINAEIEVLNGYKSDIETAESFESVREIAREVNKIAVRAKNHLQYTAGRIISNKVRAIIAQTDALEKNLERTLERLEEKGIDTNSLDEKITEFAGNIELALEQYELAKIKWDEAKNATGVDEVVKEANEYMKKSREYVAEAHELLKEIMKDVRELRQDAGLSDTEEVEEEEEEEEEEEDDDFEAPELNETEPINQTVPLLNETNSTTEA